MTIVPLPNLGRGAWTKVAKPNGSVFYEYIVDKPTDGSTTPLLDANWFAVSLGVKAIQKELNSRGYTPKLVEDSILGPATQAAAKWVQPQLGVTADGRVGGLTARLLWKREIKAQADSVGIPAKYLWATMLQESVGDPGSVGYSTPSDRGLTQINVIAHPDISPEQAHDTAYAFHYRATRFLKSWNTFFSKGSKLQEMYAICEWNNPAAARTWYNTGVAPNTKILDYYNNSLRYAATW